ncbi:hypothetical protein M1349_02635 [Patescibacteria group bacterium]|nr:hypothetical protein [Patescibacteria group bacterium]
MDKGKFLKFIDKAIAACFYLTFFLVPLAVSSKTFELFEFNKMWTVYIFTLFVGFFWIAKILASGKIVIKRTPLDIPILLFLASQVISTIFSLDIHTSTWGYYSRFNGGLLSIFSYIFLYYAFVNNLTTNEEKLEDRISFKLIIASLLSGAVVALWGFPSHFGYDPTCLVFRGSLDVLCWTDAFQPKVRIFSTLGQPNWMAAYVSVLLPITIAFLIHFLTKPFETKKLSAKGKVEKSFSFWGLKLSKETLTFASIFFVFMLLLYSDLIFTRSQSGFLGFASSIIFFIGIYAFSEFRKAKISFSSIFNNKPFKILVASSALFLVC